MIRLGEKAGRAAQYDTVTLPIWKDLQKNICNKI